MNRDVYYNLFSVHPNYLKLMDNFNCPFRLEGFGSPSRIFLGHIDDYVLFATIPSSNRSLGPLRVMSSKDCLEPDCRWIEMWGEYVYQL